jgi:hypothetical protein
MEYTKQETYLVAVNADGKYFALRESYATTSPYVVDNPADAKLITIYNESIIEDATYYFENSHRMRRWLDGFHMIKIKITTVDTIEFMH